MINVQLVQSGAPMQMMSVWKRVWIWLNPQTMQATKIRKSVEYTRACVNMIKRKGRYRFSGESWYRLTNAMIKSIFIPNLFALFVYADSYSENCVIGHLFMDCNDFVHLVFALIEFPFFARFTLFAPASR